MQLRIIFFFLFSVFSFRCTCQYLYPVATIESERNSFLCVLHQASLENVELLFYSTESKQFQKALSARFAPAAFKMIPGQNGFSFIDGGRIRIKEFIKKSPRAVFIDQPLYGFSSLEWINKNSFYLSAKRGKHFGIFQVDREGRADTVVAWDGLDCMYPQKVDDHLFFIVRSNGQCSVAKAVYPSIKKTEVIDLQDVDAILKAEQHRKKSLIDREAVEVLFSESDEKISFLHSTNKDECFFVSHPEAIDPQQELIPFAYHQLKMIGNTWVHKKLFDFCISNKLLFSESRLYESITRLVPYHHGKKVYFTDQSDIFFYDLQTKVIEQKTNAGPDEQFFAPIVLGEKLFYGFLGDSEIFSHSPLTCPSIFL